MSKLEDFHQPEKPLEKLRGNDNEDRISKEAEMKKKIQLKSEAHNTVRHPAKFSNILISAEEIKYNEISYYKNNYRLSLLIKSVTKTIENKTK